MTPILYEKDEIDFTSQGLGSLAEIYDADVAEQRNGLLQLTASYPVTGVRYDDISVGRIILAKPNQRDEPHAFRITSTDLDIMGHNVMIEADSITYDLNHNIVKHVSVNGQSGQAMMTALQTAVVNPSIFTFYSDITHVSSTSLDYVNPMEAVMGVKGSFLQIWGGELKRENRRVAMFNRRGRDNVATFRLGKNISGLKYKVDISSLVTRILPIKSVQENDTTTYLEGTPVSSQYINSYEQIYTIKVDFTDDTIKTVDDLNKASANWFVDSANTARDKPSVTIDIDVLSLQDSSDYQDKFKDLESVALTDTVTVYVPEYGINVTAIVNEIHFDPIQERVTKLTVGTAKQSFTDSSRTRLSDLQDKIISVQNQADATAVSANGKSTNYSGSVEPSHPQAGDLWYWKNGDLSGIKQFINGEWVDLVDSNTQQQIAAGVNKAVQDAQKYSDKLVADNAEQVNRTLSDVQAKQADLTAQQAELDTKAQGYANKALADAKADTLATATQTAKDAQDALATAKTDLTTSLNKEVTDRANAVTALDTKAKGYADTAKADAIATANGAVAKEVTDRQKAITDLDAKSTGAINQAKTDAQSALDALQVGTRNLLLNTNTNSYSSLNPGNGQYTTKYVPFDGGYKYQFTYTTASTNYAVYMFWGLQKDKFNPDTDYVLSFMANFTSDVTPSVAFATPGAQHSFAKQITRPKITGGSDQRVVIQLHTTPTIPTESDQGLYMGNFQYAGVGTFTIWDLKIEKGTKATDYTQAPEDIVLDYTTKDNVISQSLTQYQATNDGKVTKAQSDATQALGLVATKVSQTDYNTKTGDLDSKYTAVKQTADQASTDIVAIKSTNTSQDTKINTLTSDVSGTKQSISDIQTEQGAQSTKINTIQTDVSGTKQDISDIQDANGVQDGKIASISTTVDGLSSSFSTYKTTNDGKVAKAQADITANATAISQKVSQTAYDTKTGQLQTDLNTTTTTANQAKTDIVAIKKTNTDQDARMTTIESDANGIKTTVSSLQTTANTQAGSISTLKQRADGFDATVTKVNNLSVGGRNLLLHTNTNSYSSLTSGDGQYTTKYVPFDGGYKYQFTYTTASTNYAVYMFWGLQKDKFNPDTDYVLSFMANFSVPVTPSVLFANGASGNNFVQQKTTPTVPSGSDQRVVIQLHTNATIPTASDQSLYMGNFQRGGAGTFTIWNLKIEKGNLASSYTPAPEDVDSATAKAQLTADQATTSLNNYKSDADGRISKAQADIIVNANAITQKVSQSDYNAKTGDLTTKVNTAQSTADSATSTIGAYKTSNDARVASAESQITANATAITQKVSQMDYNTKTGQIDGQISTINQTASDISQSVSDVARQVNTLSQVNLINNSDFRPDLSGWSIQNPSSGTVTTGDYDYAGNVMVLNNTAGGMLRVNSVPITLTGTTTVSYTFNYFIFGLPAGGTVYSQLTYLDSSMKEIYSSYPSSINLATVSTGSWQKRTVSNLGITPPTGATYIVFSFDVRGAGTKAGINRPILVKGGTVGNYVPGQYVNNDKISTVSQTVDSISSIVSDPTTGLTKRVQTAEGSISTVQSNVSDLQSKQTQTANGLTTEISNRATGDTNTLTQAKDFT
ncbi:phage tail spike protein, partial [Leuconostoc lactis]|uniref:phage tail spike protein n=1 Tax=Leuconostoc lactis TaxID=1246 RepID=UPI0028A187BF